MLTNTINQYLEESSMNGMIYPSIINNMNSINILLKPICAKNNFQIEGLQTFRILEVDNNFTTIKLVRNGYPNGTRNNPNSN